MKIIRNEKRTDTTLRELLAIASDLAFEYSGDTNDAFILTRQALVEFLRDASPSCNTIDRHFPGTKYLH
jgi:hypothetical protein